MPSVLMARAVMADGPRLVACGPGEIELHLGQELHLDVRFRVDRPSPREADRFRVTSRVDGPDGVRDGAPAELRFLEAPGDGGVWGVLSQTYAFHTKGDHLVHVDVSVGHELGGGGEVSRLGEDLVVHVVDGP